MVKIFSVKDAESCILDLVQPFDPNRDREQVNLAQALGRILANNVYSSLDFPHWHNSAMDGYAVCHDDLTKFEILEIAGVDIPAGSSEVMILAAGQCARIFTGGILPEGADTVVMQEDAEINGNKLICKVNPQFGDHVRRKGAFSLAGSQILKVNTKLTAAEIGILAATRHQTVNVYRQPTIAIISTGNELVDINSDLQVGQIVDSNQYALAALVTQAGAIAKPLGIIPDRRADLFEAITRAIATSDMVISSGGVSVGDYDYVAEVLTAIGANIHIRSCAIKPGKPLTVATIANKLYFGVPGNPASAMVSFWRFINGAITKLSGSNTWYPQFVTAISQADLHAEGRRETYLWGNLNNQQPSQKLNQTDWQFQPVDNYSSGNLISLAGTNALAVLKLNQTYVPKGEPVLVMLVS